VDPLEDRNRCDSRVLRGGSFAGESWRLRSADRSWLRPGVVRSAVQGGAEPELRDAGVGFRCVRGSGRQLDPTEPAASLRPLGRVDRRVSPPA
jgi:hypothetical protein